MSEYKNLSAEYKRIERLNKIVMLEWSLQKSKELLHELFTDLQTDLEKMKGRG